MQDATNTRPDTSVSELELARQAGYDAGYDDGREVEREVGQRPVRPSSTINDVERARMDGYDDGYSDALSVAEHGEEHGRDGIMTEGELGEVLGLTGQQLQIMAAANVGPIAYRVGRWLAYRDEDVRGWIADLDRRHKDSLRFEELVRKIDDALWRDHPPTVQR